MADGNPAFDFQPRTFDVSILPHTAGGAMPEASEAMTRSAKIVAWRTSAR